jgi:hypothetical protein
MRHCQRIHFLSQHVTHTNVLETLESIGIKLRSVPWIHSVCTSHIEVPAILDIKILHSLFVVTQNNLQTL